MAAHQFKSSPIEREKTSCRISGWKSVINFWAGQSLIQWCGDHDEHKKFSPTRLTLMGIAYGSAGRGVDFRNHRR